MPEPMRVPEGFRVWKRYWFQCPHCGFGAYSAVGRLDVPQDSRGMKWRFWCPKCGRLSAMKRPQRVAALMLLATVALFVAVYFFMSALIRPGAPVLLVVVVGVGIALFATYRGIPLVSRVVNEYEPDQS
jgi:hypothetical protein